MHGAGNDFLLATADEAPGDVMAGLTAGLCCRHTGVGADGVLVLETLEAGRVRVHYWNADGTRAAFCANGTRCAARLAADRWGWPRLTLETDFASIPALVDGGAVRIVVPPPAAVLPWENLTAAGERLRGRFLVLGVPHLVVPVVWPDFWDRELVPLAPALRWHPDLPAGGANVHFLRVHSSSTIAVRSWERGVEGETLSCGSGVLAAALLAVEEGWANSPVAVTTASRRELRVESGDPPLGTVASLSGPAEYVAEITLAEEFFAAVRTSRTPG